MSFPVVDGVRFHRQDLGVQSPGDRVPVVMLHGLLTGSLASWYFTCAPGLSQDRHVVLFDQRGHGQSEVTPSGYASSTQAADLDALTAALPRFVLVGHSFGALIAARFASSAPERLRGLVLVEPPLGPRLPLPDERGGVVDVDRWLTAAGVDLSSVPRRQRLRIGELLSSTTMRADLAGEPPFTGRDATALPRPLAIVFGRRSPLAAAEDEVRAAVPHAQIALMDGGHGLHVDARDDLTAFLRDFLGSVDLHDSGGSATCADDEGVAYG